MKHPILTSFLSVSLALGMTPILPLANPLPIQAKLAPTTGSLNLLVCDVLDDQNNPVYQWDPAASYTIRMVFKSTGWLTHEAVEKDELKVGQVIKSVQADLLKSDFSADAGTVKLLSNANDPFQIEVLFKNAKWQGPGNNLSWAVTYPASQKPGINGSIPIVASDSSAPAPDTPPAPEGLGDGSINNGTDTPSDWVEGWNEYSGDPNEDPGDTSPETPKPAAAAPNLIIDNYSYGGTSVQAGKTFDLSINFMNTSRALGVENIVMSLETSEGISIANSSNTFYFETLKPRHNITQNITLRATGNGENTSPTIGVNFRYEYIDQNQRIEIQRSETIAIPVIQPERFEITEPTLPEMQVGMESVLSFPYVNKGKGTLYNVAVKIEGDVEALQPVQNLGNFESGRSGTIDAIFTTTHDGPTPFKIVVTYEDADGNEKKREFKYEPTVMAMPDPIIPDDMDQIPPEINEQPSNNWIWIIVATVIVAIGFSFWWFKKRKKKTNKVIEAEKENEDIDWFKKEDLENEPKEDQPKSESAQTPETPTSSNQEKAEE